MKPSQPIIKTLPTTPHQALCICSVTPKLKNSHTHTHTPIYSMKFPHSTIAKASSSSSSSSIPVAATPSSSSSSSPLISSTKLDTDSAEQRIEKVIYASRFMTLLGILGALLGSVLCFVKGCTYIVSSFMEYFANRGKVIILLVEAIDTYLLGTVMLVFGMGLYELFVSNLGIAKSLSEEGVPFRSNLFGLFALKERPRWLDIKTVSELKTKVGHVIVMLLLIGLFDKSKRASIHSAADLLCFSASVLLASGSLFLLSKLNDSK